jgi:hypothetical protein
MAALEGGAAALPLPATTSSAEEDGGAADISAASPALPFAVLQSIFSQLPVDTRLRCAEVCTAWRDALRERAFWTARLDLSATSALRVAAMAPLLLAASARAAGGLVALDVSRCCNVPDAVLLRVVAANGGALRELRVCQDDDSDSARPGLPLWAVRDLLRAAPGLRVMHADLDCDGAQAHLALRNEDVFGPLRVRQLRVRDTDDRPFGHDSGATLCRDVAAHASLRALCLHGVHRWLHYPGALNALVDAALALRLPALSLLDCDLPPAQTLAPPLARALDGGALTTLTLSNASPLVIEAGNILTATETMRDALRRCSTLTSLSLSRTTFMPQLLQGLAGHASLRTLHARLWRYGDSFLAAILAADAPALTALDVSSSRLGDAALSQLFRALRRSTHLRALDVSDNALSERCARDALLPSVRANGSLRQLVAAHDGADWPAAREAEALVAARAAEEEAQA